MLARVKKQLSCAQIRPKSQLDSFEFCSHLSDIFGVLSSLIVALILTKRPTYVVLEQETSNRVEAAKTCKHCQSVVSELGH